MVIKKVLEKRLELSGNKLVQNVLADVHWGINEKENATLRLYSYFALGVVEATLCVESFRQYLIEKRKGDKYRK